MKTQFTYENVNTSSIKFALNNAKSALATHSDGISRIANDITEEENIYKEDNDKESEEDKEIIETDIVTKKRRKKRKRKGKKQRRC